MHKYEHKQEGINHKIFLCSLLHFTALRYHSLCASDCLSRRNVRGLNSFIIHFIITTSISPQPPSLSHIICSALCSLPLPGSLLVGRSALVFFICTLHASPTGGADDNAGVVDDHWVDFAIGVFFPDSYIIWFFWCFIMMLTTTLAISAEQPSTGGLVRSCQFRCRSHILCLDWPPRWQVGSPSSSSCLHHHLLSPLSNVSFSWWSNGIVS